MADNDLLFNLLQFVALVAPAVAILMQVLEGAEENESPAFRLLEVGFLLIIAGALVLMFHLVTSLADTTIQIGTVLIFSSLMFLASGIAWRALPITDNISISIYSFQSLLSVTSIIIGRITAFSVPLVLAIIVSAVIDYNRIALFNIGRIREIDVLTPSDFFGIVAFLVATRVILYLVNVGYLTDHPFSDILSESVQASILLFIVFPIFVIPPFLVSELLLQITDSVVTINRGNLLLTAPYIWATLMVLILFAADFWAERDDRERLASDSED